MSEVYPAEPWHLRGDFTVGVFLVPRSAPRDSALPPVSLPAGARMLRLFGRVIVGVAAVRYGPAGILTYDELLVSIPVWHRGRLGVTIPQIWVTSPVSMTGGRELWAIPKELMTSGRSVSGRRLRGWFSAGAGRFATVLARAGRPLPGVWTLPLTTVQSLDGHEVISRNTVRGRVHPLRSRWVFDGPLSWLAGRRPVLSVGIGSADITFGAHVTR